MYGGCRGYMSNGTWFAGCMDKRRGHGYVVDEIVTCENIKKITKKITKKMT